MLGDELLIGEKIRLTALTRDDIPTLAEWHTNLELERLVEAEQITPSPLESWQDWYEAARQKQDFFLFAIRTLSDNQFLGYCNARSIRWVPRCGKIGIGIGDPAVWGQGYGADATRVLLRYCFMELGLHRVELRVIGYNTRAIRCYEKVGFKHEGALREAVLRDGQYYDIAQMAILRPEWATLYLPD